jgi:hypothetical protein
MPPLLAPFTNRAKKALILTSLSFPSLDFMHLGMKNYGNEQKINLKNH